MKRKHSQKLLALMLALCVALGLAACGGADKSMDNSAAVQPAGVTMEKASSAPDGYWMEDVEAEESWEEPAEPAEPEASARGAGGERTALPDGVKMIYRAYLDLETTEFDRAAEDIHTLTAALGGYFEEQNVNDYNGSYRRASYTVRVPAARFEDFLRQIGDLCHVTSLSQSAENVSERYYDMEARLKTARIKLERLQELLSRAELMEDIISLENAISDVEYEVEYLSGELRHYDALIDYATINIELDEVYRVTEVENVPMTFGERMGSAFRDGLREFGETLENFAEWLAFNWLTLLLLLAIVVLVWRLARRASRRKKTLPPPYPMQTPPVQSAPQQPDEPQQ